MPTPKFTALRCTDCGELYGHCVSVCRDCGCETLDNALLDGSGTVYARTTIRVPGSDHQGEEPFEVCVIDVGGEKRVRVTARVDDNPGLGPGDPVAFIERRDGAFHFRAA